MPAAPNESLSLTSSRRGSDTSIGGGSLAERDRRLAGTAERQLGLVTFAQLRGLGYSEQAIERAERRGRLHRWHPGVYAVGHTALRREAYWLAAVLACGPTAVLSHRSAAALWDLRASSRARVDVSVRVRLHPPPSIDVHHVRRLAPHEVTVSDGIRVTTVSRTLADLAGVLPRRDLERTLERAEAMRVLDVPPLLASVAHRPGARALREIVASWQPTLTRSEFEVRMLRLVRRARLPEPRVNARVADLEIDLVWPEHGLAAEADSLQFHLTRAAMERDRTRDAVLAPLGYRVLRFTDRQIRERPHEVIAALRSVLG
jgi:very-short-patch-repair endonuclease